MTKKTVTLAEMKEAVIQVYQEYNGNIPVIFKIRETSEQLYGKAAIEQYPELKKASGAYLPNGDHRGRNRGQSFIYFGTSAIHYDSRRTGGNENSNEESRGYREAIQVVKHEVLGHYALNTLTKDEKLKILNTIIENKNEPSLKEVWNGVEKLYPNNSQLQKAEEVYAFTAEKGVKLDQNYKRSKDKFSLRDLEQFSAIIGAEIKSGQREQQIYPKNNGAQFRKEKSFILSTNYKYSTKDQKMHLTINGQPPNLFDKDVLSKIRDSDKFLKSYSLENIQSGKLDLSKAITQPVAKQYDIQGNVFQEKVTNIVINSYAR